MRTSCKNDMSFPTKNEEWSQFYRTLLKTTDDWIFCCAQKAFSGVARTSWSPEISAIGTVLILLRSKIGAKIFNMV